MLDFSWKLLQGRLPTRGAFHSRGVDIDDVGCVLFNNVWEDENYLFIGCSFAFKVWLGVYSWMGRFLYGAT